jgi:hypothetical protein
MSDVQVHTEVSKKQAVEDLSADQKDPSSSYVSKYEWKYWTQETNSAKDDIYGVRLLPVISNTVAQ